MSDCVKRGKRRLCQASLPKPPAAEELVWTAIVNRRGGRGLFEIGEGGEATT